MYIYMYVIRKTQNQNVQTMGQFSYYQILIEFLKKSCRTSFTLSLNKKNLFTLIYFLQFGFRQKHSIAHALIRLTKNIFIDIWCCRAQCISKKANVMSLEGFQISGFHLTLVIVKILCQFIGLTLIKCGVPQSSLLVPLLFLI